jgi:hypothetical protein
MGSQLVPRLLAGHTDNARYRTLERVDGQNCSLAIIFIGTFPRPLPARAGARLSKQAAEADAIKTAAAASSNPPMSKHRRNRDGGLNHVACILTLDSSDI